MGIVLILVSSKRLRRRLKEVKKLLPWHLDKPAVEMRARSQRRGLTQHLFDALCSLPLVVSLSHALILSFFHLLLHSCIHSENND